MNNYFSQFQLSVLIVITLNFFSCFIGSSYGPYLTLSLSNHYSEAWLTVGYVMYSVGAFPAYLVTTRIGIEWHAWVVSVGLALFAIASALAGVFYDSYYWFCGLRFLAGFGMSLSSNFCFFMLASWVEEDKKAKAMGILEFFAGVGFITGPLFGARLYSAYGAVIAFYVGAAATFGVILLFLGLVWVRNVNHTSNNDKRRSSDDFEGGEVQKTRNDLLSIQDGVDNYLEENDSLSQGFFLQPEPTQFDVLRRLSTFPIFICFFALFLLEFFHGYSVSVYSIYLNNHFGWTSIEQSWLFMISGIVYTAASLIVGYTPKWVLHLGILTLSVGYLFMSFADSYAFILSSMCINSVGGAMIIVHSFPNIIAFSTRQNKEEINAKEDALLYSMVSGLFTITFCAGQIAGPFLALSGLSFEIIMRISSISLFTVFLTSIVVRAICNQY